MVYPASANLSPSIVKSCSVKTFGFLILPNFTTIGLASAVETLRMANLAARKPLFRSVLIAADEAPVVASNGMRYCLTTASPTPPSWMRCWWSGPTRSTGAVAAAR